MADTKISATATAGTITGAEIIPILQSATNKKVTVDAILGDKHIVAYDQSSKLYYIGDTPGEYIDTNSVFNVMTYGATGDGTTDDTGAINATLAAISKAAVWNDPRLVEGGILYFPRGKYKITTKIDLSSGETVEGRRQFLTLQGDGMGASIIYSDTLKEMFSSTTAGDHLSIRDLQVISYATYTGLGTLEKLMSFQNCMFLNIERCRFYVRYPGARNTDCVLLWLDSCYYSAITDCVTTSFGITTANKHNVTYAAAAIEYGSTHIRAINNNALYVTNHKWDNCYRGMHLINEDGAVVYGGAIEQYVQGFLLDASDFNSIEGVRFETHPDSVFQYLGDGVQYSVLCDENSTYNRVRGGGYTIRSNVADYGFIDYNGHNSLELNQILARSERLPIIRNGDFALGGYTDTTFKIPGWLVTGSPTVTNELSDLPPEPNIKRAIRIVTTANVHGIKTANFLLDPEKMATLNVKFWMKRVSGDHSLRAMLHHATAGYLITNMLTYAGTNVTNAKSGIPIASVSWLAGSLTVNTDIPNHFVKVNQKITLSGFTVSGVSLNSSYLVTSITDANTFVLAVASDPGTVSVVGTMARVGIDDIANLEVWQEYKVAIGMRRNIIGINISEPNITFTFNTNHLIPNSANSVIKLFGMSNPLYNTTHTVISTTSTTVTIVKPGGAAPTEMGHGYSSLTGIPFYGYGGFYGNVSFILGSEFASPNVTATHLVTGVVIKPASGTSVISDAYLPGVEILSALKSYDWPSCAAFAAGSTQTTTVTVTGAVAGDIATAGMSPSNSGLIISAIVTSTDTVTVTIFNTTAAPIDLAAPATLTVAVTHLY